MMQVQVQYLTANTSCHIKIHSTLSINILIAMLKLKSQTIKWFICYSKISLYHEVDEEILPGIDRISTIKI